MKILIAGIGNVFFGDDAFGCEVVRRLKHQEMPGEVTVTDYGIRSYDLAYALTDGFDKIILVDAVPRGGIPGTVYLIEPDRGDLQDIPSAPPDGHSMNPLTVIQMAESFGGLGAKLFLVGCEPETLEGNSEMVLSTPVQEAVPQALAMIESLLGKWLANKHETQTAGFIPA